MLIGLSHQVRMVDELTTKYLNISGVSLMQNAANAVFDVLKEHIFLNRKICIMCGRGNNAGDGFALACMLAEYGCVVTVSLLCGKEFSSDAMYYFEKIPDSVDVLENKIVDADVYVDAVFGTGFHGELPPFVEAVFSKINQTSALKLAIDLPSGVNADSGECAPNSFCADITVTFEVLKRCHVLPQSLKLCGEIIVRSISLSAQAVSDAGICTKLLDGFTLPTKPFDLHKGKSGLLFSIVGCKQYQGAATLSVKASLRSGCGLLMAFVPMSVYSTVAAKVDEAILCSCAENPDGMHLTNTADLVVRTLEKRPANAILVGSGMGIQSATREITEMVLGLDIPCVVDGDSLRYINDQMLLQRSAPIILTPHLGEFARMVGEDVEVIQSNRFEICKKYAMDHHCILVLKDAMTLISAYDGEQWVLSRPNAGLAKGGSGDVLAGMTASFLAQGFSAVQAALGGVWFHSEAARICREEMGEYAMLPSDVIERLPKVLN